ncbi:hypothetical protein KM043_009919 [Ampulex compressa]|nr:hypothetical protein KM043_009919 [Ampulex compressa]
MYEEQGNSTEEEEEGTERTSTGTENMDERVINEHEYEDESFHADDYEHSIEGEEWSAPEEGKRDWEVEAKKKVRIEIEEPMERRKTIYELDSYASSGPSVSDILKLSTTDVTAEPPMKIRYSVSMGARGIARINLSPLTQKIIGCVIGENVTTEYPWVYVRKEIIEDNIDLHEESSDFLSMKDEIHAFPDPRILIGYAPSLTDEAQFYICLTEEGRDEVVRRIQLEREDHENRVRNAVYKPAGEWQDLGSGIEIEDSLVKKRRPLFEIEVASTVDLLASPPNLVDRKADEQRDGYIELLPYRQTFENVPRRLVSRTTQVAPETREGEAQTTPSIPANSWFQYRYEYQQIDLAACTEDQTESLKDFLRRYTDEMCEQTLLNATWDIYTNDYQNLVVNEKDTQTTVPMTYTQHQSYHAGKLTGEKVISDLSWHPLWTGVPVAAYAEHAKAEHLVGPKPHEKVLDAHGGDNRVLVWSFSDCLTPKLVLECPREVTAVATCPLDGNIIIGGCANGQVAIWHIPGKIEQVEAVVVHTSAQVKYRIAMKSLTRWMREAIGSSVVQPATMSSHKYSQKGAITQIIWVSSYHKVDKNGRIRSLPEDTSPDDLSLQFVTASEDGTIAFWDLKWRPSKKVSKQAQKKQRQVPRPEALEQSISPYKALDRVFRPEYILVVQYPDESRRPVITTLSMYRPKFHKEQVEPFPLSEDITIRRYYKPVVKKPDFEMKPEMLVGTVEGDFGCITWEGFEFTTDVIVNREVCRWKWIKRMHDGPVTHTVRSKYHTDVIATVGGKIFAVWREDFGEPLIWKKSQIGYTACSWGGFRPAVLILARMDGTVEIWDFIVKSHEPCFAPSLSGRIITGIHTHDLPLNPQCVGFCDFNGTLRMHVAPASLRTYDVADIHWTRNFIDRQANRIKEFQAWQKSWSESNLENIERKKRLADAEAEKKRLEAEEKMKVEIAEAAARLTASKKSILTRRPWEFIEDAKTRWKSMELMRMQRVILEKKGLRKDELEKQRAPILKLRQEARRKKRKIRETLQLQDKIFEETVAFLFPEQHQERKRASLSLVDSGQERRSVAAKHFVSTDTILQKEVQDYFVDPDEEVIYNFLEVQAEALASIQSRPFEHSFDWRKVLREGKSRRRSLDTDLRRLNKRKIKFSDTEEILMGP